MSRLTRGTKLQLCLALCAVFATSALFAQQPAAPAGLPQRFAPIDLTGTWVTVVTEDWAVRMITPPKGDFESLPLTPSAREAANRVDMAQVEAAGRACEAYGAPTIMREPGRLRIAWQDANTLKIDADAGQQTRLLQFAAPDTLPGPSRQGLSIAEWQYAGGFDPRRAAEAPPAGARGGGVGGGGIGGGGIGRGRGGATSPTPVGGRLKVITSRLAPGFLRKNGVPYSAGTTLTEYFNLLTEPGGTPWIVVTTVVHDPENLAVDYITSTNLRREPNEAKWKPLPCSLK